MGLLRDWHYVEKAVQIPALAELIREALIHALFVRDDRVLPRDLIADLNRVPPVTVKVKEDAEVRKLVRVLNGQESTVRLGLSAEDYHYFRGHLVPFVPTVPLDFAVGDALYGDAPFASFRGGFASYVNALRTISAYGQRARIGFEEVANHATAYDLLHTVIPLAGEFFIPLS